MHHYQLNWNFASQEDSWAAGVAFADYIRSGSPADRFDGFEVKYRVCDPQGGWGTAIVCADHISKVWQHSAPWIKHFKVQIEINPVMSDDEFVANQEAVYAAAG